LSSGQQHPVIASNCFVGRDLISSSWRLNSGGLLRAASRLLVSLRTATVFKGGKVRKAEVNKAAKAYMCGNLIEVADQEIFYLLFFRKLLLWANI
jgi:hypothetical protein